MDGTLLEACAGLKSFKRKDANGQEPPEDPGNPTVNFHGEKRRNETHASTTDPEALLARKGAGKEAKLSYCGNVLMDNRYGLAADVETLAADGLAERVAAVVMVAAVEGEHQVTVGADKGYDIKSFVEEMRDLKATPHVARKDKVSAIDARTTRHEGYKISQEA